MNTNTGLKLLVAVLAVTTIALGIRVFAPRKPTSPYTLVLDRVPLAGNPKLADAQAKVKDGKDCAMSFREKQSGDDLAICPGQSGIVHAGDKNGAPHVQQTVSFQHPDELQTLVNALQMSGSSATSTAPAPVAGEPDASASASPAPHVQQTASVETPANQRAVAAALQR